VKAASLIVFALVVLLPLSLAIVRIGIGDVRAGRRDGRFAVSSGSATERWWARRTTVAGAKAVVCGCAVLALTAVLILSVALA
jgi:hypothetical protein